MTFSLKVSESQVSAWEKALGGARNPVLKKTTIVDIAKAAGVSVSTVSRILNNKPDVAEETRQRVLQVIEEQRFAPQMSWQQLRSGKSRFITLHFPAGFQPTYADDHHQRRPSLRAGAAIL